MLGAQTQQKEIARLTGEVVVERRKLQSLRDTHNDLLSLLAQGGGGVGRVSRIVGALRW